MNNIDELSGPWLYCQTILKETLRWSKYVLYENGKRAEENGIRRQNVADHTLSKLLVYAMLLPTLEKVFGKNVNFKFLFTCITYHDLGEGLRNQKYDILANDKKDSHDVEEYMLLMSFLDKSGLKNKVIRRDIKKAFLLQFALTSYESFPSEAQKVMQTIRKNKVLRNTAILFQIVEKWEYLFYAHEHKDKHPTILNDVITRNAPLISSWIGKYPKSYHQPLRRIFAN